MTKTPEQMAEEFFENWQPEKPKYIRPKARQYALEKVTECFIAGYQAAKDEILSKGMQGYITEIRNDAWCTAMQLGQQSQWISVKERLPETNELCIVNTEFRAIVPALYGNESWIFDDGQGWLEKALSYVSHWMPMPKLPEEEADD